MCMQERSSLAMQDCALDRAQTVQHGSSHGSWAAAQCYTKVRLELAGKLLPLLCQGQGVQRQPHLLGRLGLGQRLVISLCFGAQQRIHLPVQLGLHGGPISPGLLEHDLGQQHVAVGAVPARSLACVAWLGQALHAFRATMESHSRTKRGDIHQTGASLWGAPSIEGSAVDLVTSQVRHWPHRLGLARGVLDFLHW